MENLDDQNEIFDINKFGNKNRAINSVDADSFDDIDFSNTTNAKAKNSVISGVNRNSQPALSGTGNPRDMMNLTGQVDFQKGLVDNQIEDDNEIINQEPGIPKYIDHDQEKTNRHTVYYRESGS